jgi:lipopolysaccharide/colanic/teichoic acid biosynthesis glycosyltransferase
LSDRARPLLIGSRRREVSLLRRLIDVCVVLLVAPIAIAVVLAVVVLIKLDSPGPAFYANERSGTGGRRFRMWKLRTMVQDAEARRDELMHLNRLSWPDFKLERDPRVTRIGRLLRATSIDELPQLWHVLRGDMTLVGPRASFIDVANYRLWQTERLEYRPGLFGSWQADGRGTARFDERCRMDIRDRRAQSLGHDITLAVDTIVALLRRTGRR